MLAAAIQLALCRHHDDGGVPDPDLVALLQPLGLVNAASVEPGAVGRAEVFDVPKAMGELEQGVVAGGVVVADGQRALAPRGEFGVKDAGLIAGLDDKRLAGEPVGEGGVALAGDGGHGGLPGLLLLLSGVFPRRQSPGVCAAVGFVCGLREAFEVSASHPIDDARGSRGAVKEATMKTRTASKPLRWK
jgi:hypothetical protein